MKENNPGAELAARRKIELKPCAFCGEDMEGLKNKKYCDESCKQRAKYLRNKSKTKKA